MDLIDDIKSVIVLNDYQGLIRLTRKHLGVFRDGVVPELPETDLEKLAQFAKHTQTFIVDNIREINFYLLGEIRECIDLCYNTLEVCKATPKKPLAQERDIFNIIVGLCNRSFIQDCYPLAKFLYPKLVSKFPLDPKWGEQLSHNLYVYLWMCSNETIASSLSKVHRVFQLRNLAILYRLINSEKGSALVLNKITTAPEKMASSLRKLTTSIKDSKHTSQILVLYNDSETYCEEIFTACFEQDQSVVGNSVPDSDLNAGESYSSLENSAGNTTSNDKGKALSNQGLLDSCTSTGKNMSATYTNPDLYKMFIFVESICWMMRFKWIYTDDKDVPKVFKRFMTFLSGSERFRELQQPLTIMCNDISATCAKISAVKILSSTRKIVTFIESVADVGQKLILLRVLWSYCIHFLLYFRGKGNQQVTSRIPMAAYSGCSVEEQVTVEEIYHLAVQAFNTQGVEACKKAKKEKSREETMKDCQALEVHRLDFMSDCVSAMASRLQRSYKSLAKDERVSIGKKINDLCGEISVLLKAVNWSETTLYIQEHKQFAILADNVGRTVNNLVSCEQAVPLFEYTLVHFKLWLPKATKEDREKYSLQNRYDMLAATQRKAGFFKDAMVTICQMVLNNKTYLVKACEAWAYVKYAIVKTSGLINPLLKRTLWQEVQCLCAQTKQKCALSEQEVIKRELEAVRDKDLAPEIQMGLVEDLLAKASQPLVKARLLLLKASNAWTSRNGNAISLIEESLKLVKSCDPQEKTYHDDLAMAYLMLYIVKDVDASQMEKMREEQSDERKKKKKQKGPQEDKLEELEQAELFTKCCTLGDEVQLMSPCVSALESWEALSSIGLKRPHFQFLGESTVASLTLAQIFKLRDWTTHEARALQVAVAMGKLAQFDNTTLEATWLLCRLFNTNVQPHVTIAVIEETEVWIKSLGPAPQKDIMKSKPYIQLWGAHAEALLLQNKLEEGYASLKKALQIKQDHIYKRSGDDLQLDGYLYLIQARFLSLPKRFWPKDSPPQARPPLQLAESATRSVAGIVTSVLGDCFLYGGEKSSEKCNVMDKWGIIDQLLECHYEVGSIYIQVGDFREANIYVTEGILIAKTFNLPKRRSMFHLLHTRLYNISEKFPESKAHLHSVSFIYNGTTSPALLNISDKQNLTMDSNDAEKSPSPDQSNEAFQVKTLDLQFEEHVTIDSDSRPMEKASSPKHKKGCVAKELEFLRHGEECKCVFCMDVEAVRVGLMYVICSGEMYIMEGNYENGKDKLHDLLQTRVELFTKKAVSVLEGVLKNIIPGLIKRKHKKEVKPHTFEDIIVEGCKLMAYISLIDLDLKAHQEWTRKLDSYLRLKTCPWVVNSWVTMAESQHLSVVPKLPWPTVEKPAWELEDIYHKIDQLHIKNSSDVQQCFTPIAVRKREPAEAPVKRRKGLLGLIENVDLDHELSNKTNPKFSDLSSVCVLEKDLDRDQGVNKKMCETTPPKLKNVDILGVNSDKSKHVQVVSMVKSPSLPNLTKCNDIKSKDDKMKTLLNVENAKKGDAKKGSDVEISLVKAPSLPNLEKCDKDSNDEGIMKALSTVKSQKKVSKHKDSDRKASLVKTPSLPNLEKREKINGKGETMRAPSKVKSNKKGDEQKNKDVKPALVKTPSLPNIAKCKSLNKENEIIKTPLNSKTMKKGEEKKKQTGTVKTSTMRAQNLAIYDLDSDDEIMKTPLNIRNMNKCVQKKKQSATVKASAVKTPAVQNMTKLNLDSDDEIMNTPLKFISADKTKNTGVIGGQTKGPTKKAGMIARKKVNEKESAPVTRMTRSRTAKEGKRGLEDSDYDSDEIAPDLEDVISVLDHWDSSLVEHSMSDPDAAELSLMEGEEYQGHRSLIRSMDERECELMDTLQSIDMHSETGDLGNEIEFARAGGSDEENISPELEKMDDAQVKSTAASNLEFSVNVDPASQRNQQLLSVEDRATNRTVLKPSAMKKIDLPTQKNPQVPNPSVKEKVKNKTVLKTVAQVTPSPAITASDTLRPVATDTTPDSPGKSRTIKKHLLHAFNLLRSKPPSIPYRQICHALATIAIRDGNTKEVTYYLTESQCVILRYRAFSKIFRKRRILMRESKAKPEGTDANKEDCLARLMQMEQTLSFTKEVAEINKAVQVLPKGWTVCQLTVMKRPSQKVGDLYAMNIVKGQPTLVHKLTGYSTTAGKQVLPAFAEILRGNNVSMYLKDRKDWWNTREKLNTDVKKLLESITSVWLGGGQSFLHGNPVSDSKVKQIDSAVTELCKKFKDLSKLSSDKKRLLMMLVKSCHILKDRDLLQMVCEMAGELEVGVLEQLLREIRRVNGELQLAGEALHPVILVLDRTIQQLPWENLDFLKTQPVSRIPNLYFLELLLRQQLGDPKSLLNTGMDPSNAFYVLNPDSNLPSTQTQFEELFSKQLGWSGVTGERPTVEQVGDSLSKRDLYVYCGHGGGTQCVHGDTLTTFQCRACVLLMGCSSGKLTASGQLEADGQMLNYLLIGCPCIIANLWDVTDKDIDRFTEQLIKGWTTAADGTRITQPMEASRQTCRLKALMGTAPAVYGLPIKICHKQKVEEKAGK